MKNIKRIIGIAVVVAAIAGIAISCGMIQKTPESVQKTVIGKVSGTNITISQIEPQMQQVYSSVEQQVQGNPMDNPQAKQFIIQQREKAVNALIDQKVVEEQIATQKITVPQADIDAQYNQMLDGFIKQSDNDKAKGTAAFDAALKQAGYADANAYKAAIKTQLEDKALAETITKTVPKVTEADAQTYYNENPAVYTSGDIYDIVVKTQAEADKLRDQYLTETKGMTNVQDKLAVFKKIAEANNIDDTKSTGGSLGTIEYASTTYTAPFMTAVNSLKQAGDVSEVVNSMSNAYNIAFAASVTKQSFAEANKDNAIVTKLQQQKDQQAIEAKLAEWRKADNAEVLTDKLDYAVPVVASSTQGQGSTAGQ